jgi:hypothetical protein
MCEKRSFQVSKFESVDFTIKSCVTCVFAFSSLHESVDFGTVCTKIQKFEYFRQILCSHLCLFVGKGLTLCLRQQAETDTKQRPRGSGSDEDGTPLPSSLSPPNFEKHDASGTGQNSSHSSESF